MTRKDKRKKNQQQRGVTLSPSLQSSLDDLGKALYKQMAKDGYKPRKKEGK